MFFRQLSSSIGIELNGPTTVFSDSQSALAMIVFIFGLCYPLPLFLPFAVFAVGFGHANTTRHNCLVRGSGTSGERGLANQRQQ